MKNLANMITSSRFVFAALLLFAIPFSAFFWVFYWLGVVSDILDGLIARKMRIESETGAKLDSLADLTFMVVILIVILRNSLLSAWGLCAAAVVIFIRVVSYLIGYHRFHTFVSLHTYLNKAAGFVFLTYPVLCRLLNNRIPENVLIVITVLSALEELIIILRMKELDRNCKGII